MLSSREHGAMAVLSLDQIEELTTSALTRCGASALQAGATARSVRDAEAEGIRNVGLGYLPVYCSHLLCGKVVGTAVPTVAEPDGAMLQADAHLGFAHPAFEAALEPFDRLVRSYGVAVLTVTRSYSAGVLGWMVDLLARRRFVALGFANSSPLVAPWGGRVARLGTNPLAYAVPRAGRRPARVRHGDHRHGLRQHPPRCAGEPTDPARVGPRRRWHSHRRPQRALAGTVAPLGGAKGFGLGMLVEIMAAG